MWRYLATAARSCGLLCAHPNRIEIRVRPLHWMSISVTSRGLSLFACADWSDGFPKPKAVRYCFVRIGANAQLIRPAHPRSESSMSSSWLSSTGFLRNRWSHDFPVPAAWFCVPINRASNNVLKRAPGSCLKWSATCSRPGCVARRWCSWLCLLAASAVCFRVYSGCCFPRIRKTRSCWCSFWRLEPRNPPNRWRCC